MSVLVRLPGARSWFLLSMVVLSAAGHAHGQDPAPPWNDLLKSELVVVGQYRSHKNGTLSLEVVEVLRGKTCKAGDVLPVQRSQRIGFKFQVREDVKGNVNYVDRLLGANDTLHFPKMYFIDEVGKRIQESLITYNAEAPHVYFFAKQDQPVLDRADQVQPDRRRGWKRILDCKPADASFHILNTPTAESSRKALLDLVKTRDREALDGLLEGMLEPRANPQWVRTRELAERVLRSLGDRDGDVYEPVLKALSGGLGADYDNAYRLARVLARADSKRALADFKKLLQPRSGVSTDGILVSLHHLESEEGLDLMFEWMKAGRTQAYYSFEEMMFNRHSQGSGTRMVERARLQELAVPRLRKALQDRAFPSDVHNTAMFYANFRFLAEEPPLDYQGWRNGTGFDNANRCPHRDGFPDWQRLEWESKDDLEPFLKADLIEGRKRLKDGLANLPPAAANGPVERLILQHFAHRYGDADMVKEFKAPADPMIRFMEGNAARFHRLPFSQFMKEFEKTPKRSADYWSRVAALFPAHADFFFQEMEAMLLSEEKLNRDFAIYHLKDRLFWDFEFDADDYPYVNRKKLDALKPLLGRLSRSRDPLEMRGIMLQHFGVKLEGPPGRGWLPAVEAAVLRWNPVIHMNALCVLGMIEEDPAVMRFANYPLTMRQKELEGHLKQRRAKNQNVPAQTAEQFQAVWKAHVGQKDVPEVCLVRCRPFALTKRVRTE